jgi:hypothetical protein
MLGFFLFLHSVSQLDAVNAHLHILTISPYKDHRSARAESAILPDYSCVKPSRGVLDRLR